MTATGTISMPSSNENGHILDELRFKAMGTTAHVIVVGHRPGADARSARRRIEALEQKWSRFIPESEVSRLNRGSGMPMPVSEDTCALFARAVGACSRTDGRFNPFVGGVMERIGYDESFPAVVARRVPRRVKPTTPAGQVSVTINEERSVIAFDGQSGCSFDPGGIGKGFAADLVVEELMANGADGALVNIGGDLRVEGLPPAGDQWIIELTEPSVRGANNIVVALTRGALATSTTGRRRWPTISDDISNAAQHINTAHHIVDPATGAPRSGQTVLATAVAAQGWWAEVCATAMTGGDVRDRLPPGISALLIDETGTRHLVGQSAPAHFRLCGDSKQEQTPRIRSAKAQPSLPSSS